MWLNLLKFLSVPHYFWVAQQTFLYQTFTPFCMLQERVLFHMEFHIPVKCLPFPLKSQALSSSWFRMTHIPHSPQPSLEPMSMASPYVRN